LFQQVVSIGESSPQAYLFCANTAAEPRIYCTHAPCRYISSLDGTPTPWDNKSFAFLGDLVQNLISTIQFPDNAFEEIQVQVQTADYMLHHLDDLNISPVFIPVEPDAEDLAVQENRTRHFIYLPAVYVPLLLSAGGYTVHQAWELLYPGATTMTRHDCLCSFNLMAPSSLNRRSASTVPTRSTVSIHHHRGAPS
jgi:hypothetical protein